MKQTHSYSSTHYTHDNGFPLSWCCRCWMSDATDARRAEAEDHYQRTKTRPGIVVGRPATRNDFMLYKKQSSAQSSEGADNTEQSSMREYVARVWLSKLSAWSAARGGMVYDANPYDRAGKP